MRKKPKSPIRKTRRDRIDREEAIITATVKLIGSVPMTSLTLDLVAKECGTTRSHIVYYHKTIEALVEHVVAEIVEKSQHHVMERLAFANNPREKIAALIQGYSDFFLKNRDHGRVLILMYFNGAFDEAYRDLCTEITDAAEERIAHVLAAHLETPSAYDSPKVKNAARHVRSMLLGMLFMALTYGKKFDAPKETAMLVERAFMICDSL